MARLKLILVVATLLTLALLAYRNSEPVEIDLLAWQFPMPTTVLILAVGSLGFVAGTIFGARIPRKLKVEMVPEGKAKPTKKAASESVPQSPDDTSASN